MKCRKKLEMSVYQCQVGMYFSGIQQLGNGFVVYSDVVEDEEWNFWTGFSAESIEDFENAYKEAKDFFEKIKRNPCFVVGRNTKISQEVRRYIKRRYDNFVTNSILVSEEITPIKPVQKEVSYRKIDNEKEADLFVDVFKTSKSQARETDTYPPLADYYFRALAQSFNNKTDWEFVHYLSYFGDQPVGMISCCVKGDCCGLYGGGTYLKYRGKGIFSSLLKHVENDLKGKGVKYFFCISKKESYNDEYYHAINLKRVVDNRYYK